MNGPESFGKGEQFASRVERLHEAVVSWSAVFNEELIKKLHVPQQYDLPVLLDDECRVNMSAFTRKHAGEFSKEEVGADKKTARTNELSASGAHELSVQARYETNNQDVILETWKKENRNRDGTLAEIVALSVLNKKLGSRFIAVRSSPYDDYANGVDTLIIDRETESVVCAFDEVVGLEDGSREHAKQDRMRKRLEGSKNGMRVKYGLVFSKSEDGDARLLRRALTGIPGFCISITHTDLHAIIQTSDFAPGSSTTEREDHFFEHIIASLESQRTSYADVLQSEHGKAIDTLISYAKAQTRDTRKTY